MDRFINRLQGAELNRDHYRVLLAHVKIALTDDSFLFSAQMEDWRCTISRNNLTETIALPDWIPALNLSAATLVTHARDFSSRSLADVSQLAVDSPESGAILDLYRAAIVAFSNDRSITPESSWCLLSPARWLADSIRVPQVAHTTFARIHDAAASVLDVPGDFKKLGPSAKIRRLAESTASPSELIRFLNTGDQMNISHQVRDSPKSAASGIQFYASFCDLIQVNYFPPATENILRVLVHCFRLVAHLGSISPTFRKLVSL